MALAVESIRDECFAGSCPFQQQSRHYHGGCQMGRSRRPCALNMQNNIINKYSIKKYMFYVFNTSNIPRLLLGKMV
jgi:hypothetical protein